MILNLNIEKIIHIFGCPVIGILTTNSLGFSQI